MLLEKWSLDVNEKLLFSKSEELGMQVHLTSSFLNFHSNPLIQHQFSTDITNIKSNIKYELKTITRNLLPHIQQYMKIKYMTTLFHTFMHINNQTDKVIAYKNYFTCLYDLEN